jgi:lysophospholipase L1-like esterase
LLLVVLLAFFPVPSLSGTADHHAPVVAHTTTTPAPRVIAVVGDSIFLGVRDGLPNGVVKADTAGTIWDIDAESGFGWGASGPDWPLSVVHGSWVHRHASGLLARHPDTLVVELGANDALRASFAIAERQPGFARQILAGVATNVGRVLEDARGRTRCVVLVTAPTQPTTLFGAGALYVRQATLVNSTLRRVAASHKAVAIADWARWSAGHYHVDGSAGNWFAPDGLHLDTQGQSALLTLVQRTATACHG